MRDALRRANSFRRELTGLAARAESEARGLGSSEVEAEHLLLAAAAGGFGRASQVLERLGLSRERVAAAIDRERLGALALAGVDAAAVPRPRWVDTRRGLRWGRSALLAAERSVVQAPADPAVRMLLGIVDAEAGVVPRVLAELRVSAADLRRALGPDSPGPAS